MTTNRLESVEHAISVAQGLGYSREAGQAAIDNLVENIGYVMFTDDNADRAASNYDLFVALLAQYSPPPP